MTALRSAACASTPMRRCEPRGVVFCSNPWQCTTPRPSLASSAASRRGVDACSVSHSRRRLVTRRAQPGDGSKDNEYVEVKVDSVRVQEGSAQVNLKLLESNGLVVTLHIGVAESEALLKEINKNRQPQPRPLTYDLTKNIMQAVGFRVTKLRITNIQNNTFFARIHVCSAGSGAEAREVDIDCRPSDGINLALRFGAPMYINKKIAETAAPAPPEPYPAPVERSHHRPLGSALESQAEIARSCREALSSYEDPTIMLQLQKDLAIRDERYAEARALHEKIATEMTSNPVLRVVVAMEAALADHRLDEAARLRDEYRRLTANSNVQQSL